MRKLKIINNTNTFRGCSCHGRTPKTFVWDHVNEIISSDPIVLYNDCIFQVLSSQSTNKRIYGWLGESSEVISPITQCLLSNINHLKQKIKCIYTHDKRLINLDEKFFVYAPPASNLPWVKDCGIHTKNKLCSFITSSKNTTIGHKVRIAVLNYLQNDPNMKEHIFGREIRPIEKKEIGLNDYMFSIVIENGFYPKYYTEKIMDAFATGTVPLYVGDRSICEDFDENGIIFIEKDGTIDLSVLSSLSEDLYLSKMKHIENNFEIATNKEMSDDIIARKVFQDD